MSQLPDLLNTEEVQPDYNPYETPAHDPYAYGDVYDEEDSSTHSSGAGSKILFSLMFVVLAGAIGGISYFGIGPMLAPPENEVVYNSTSPDVADVLGLSNSQPMLDDNLSDADKQALLQQLASLVEIPAGASAGIFRLTTPPAADEGTFFSQAKSGDVLIIFKDYGIAYLLRSEENKVVATGEISAANN